ncbi:MAG: hypothetical protein IJ876_00500 [Elusimicrobiaceae bacterium]|nr:hypothetical protein [Elusimicrobiaceae bacterium]
MKLTWKQTGALLAVLACMTLPAHAQKGKALSKVVDTAVSRQAAQQAVRNPHYNRVLGYNTFRYKVPHTRSTYINTTLREADHLGLNTVLSDYINTSYPIQVAPITQANKAENAFADYELLVDDVAEAGKVAKFAQAYYLWRFTHPKVSVVDMPRPLKAGVDKILDRRNSARETAGELDDYPTIEFLTMVYVSRAQSYTALAAKTTAYPKRIVLDERGWPEQSKECWKAHELDLYLMQSRWMGEFYNAIEGNHYTPFTLTNEEQQAADQLLDLRTTGDALPANPTARDLLSNMYNQLEREMWPYYDAGWVTQFVNPDEGVYTEYLSYINYAKNPTAIAIRKMVKEAGDTAWQESLDMAHLMVMDFMINNGPKTFSYYSNALAAYKKVYQEISSSGGNNGESWDRLEGMGRIVAQKAVVAKGFKGSEEINQLGREIGELVK